MYQQRLRRSRIDELYDNIGGLTDAQFRLKVINILYIMDESMQQLDRLALTR